MLPLPARSLLFSRRIGEAIAPDRSGPLHDALSALEEALSPQAVKQGVAASAQALESLLGAVRAGLAAAVPEGLPVDEPALLLAADVPAPADDNTDGSADGSHAAATLRAMVGPSYLDPATAELWIAGRALARSGSMGDRLGRNEKTRAIAKLQAAGQGAPTREPAVSDAERQAMMAWHFRRLEEKKALAADGDDRFLGSGWADPRALKASLNGTAGISWRPGGGGGSAAGLGR